MENFPIKTHRPKIILYTVMIASLILLILTVWVYQFNPIQGENADYANTQLYCALVLIAALATAVCGTLLTLQFKPHEAPFLIWGMFTLGWWMWVGGEAYGMALNKVYWDLERWPDITLADGFWTAGYLFFLLALFFQFRLIYGGKKRIGMAYYGGIVLLTLLLTLGVTQLALKAGLGADRSWISLYQALFYPVGDFCIGVAALWLLLLFRRGLWGRPWGGLILFALSDAVNIFWWIGGYDRLGALFANPEPITQALDLFSLTTYSAGYLFVAIAFLTNYNLIQFGPPPSRRASSATPTTPRPTIEA